MLDELNQKLTAAFEALNTELGGIRAGRASAGLVENLMADVYGAKTPIKQIASITVPDPKSLAIQPWDKSNLAPIEKAVRDSELSLNPINDGLMIRINIPPLSEERRMELVKLIGQKSEAAKIAVRNIRHDFVSRIDSELKAKTLGEDDHKRQEKQIQDKIGEFNAKIDDALSAKETEIKTV